MNVLITPTWSASVQTEATTTSSAIPQQTASPDLPDPTTTPTPSSDPKTGHGSNDDNGDPIQGGASQSHYLNRPVPSESGAVSGAGSGHADEHSDPTTIPDNAFEEAPTLTSLGGQRIQTAAEGTIVAGGSSIEADGHAIIQGATGPNEASNAIVVDGTSYAKHPIASLKPTQASIITFESSTYTRNGASHFVVEGQTLTKGGAITVHSTPISYLPSGHNVVIGTSTQRIASSMLDSVPEPVVTIAGSAYHVDSSSRLVIYGQTLKPGGSITVHGTPVAYLSAGDGVVVGTSTHRFTAAAFSTPQRTVMTFAGIAYSVGSSSQIAIEGQILTPGKTITVHGTPIAYASSGKGVVVGTSTHKLSTIPAPSTQKTIMTFAGSMYTLDSSSDLVIQRQTLTPGGTITVHGTPIAYPSSNLVQIGSSRQTLSTVAAAGAQEIVMTFASSNITEASSAFIIDGQTLSKGATITIDGTPIAYPSSSNIVVIGTSTQTLSSLTDEPVMTFARSTYTALASAFIIRGQTLTEGGKITVTGTPISFAAAGTDVVVGSSTEDVHLGSLIMGGFGTGLPTEGASAFGTATPIAFTAGQTSVERNCWLLFALAGWTVTTSIVALVS